MTRICGQLVAVSVSMTGCLSICGPELRNKQLWKINEWSQDLFNITCTRVFTSIKENIYIYQVQIINTKINTKNSVSDPPSPKLCSCCFAVHDFANRCRPINTKCVKAVSTQLQPWSTRGSLLILLVIMHTQSLFYVIFCLPAVAILDFFSAQLSELEFPFVIILFALIRLISRSWGQRHRCTQCSWSL